MFYAFYRQVPAACSGRPSHGRHGRGPGGRARGARRGAASLVGDGALRYAGCSTELSDVEAGVVGRPTRRPASLVELAQPKALREEFVQPWELEPLYLRQADVEIGWDAATGRAPPATAAIGRRPAARCRSAAGPSKWRPSSPMRRRHLRAVLRIEAQVYPRPWSLALFMSELALRTSRAYVSPGSAAPSSATPA